MDATLVTVTVLSMTMAAALSAIVWRMLRLERQRSNARVASLAAAALRTEKPVQDRSAQALKPAAGETVSHGFRVVGQAYKPDENDLPLAPRSLGEAGPSADAPVNRGLFVEREHESPWGPRFAVMTALALVIASVVLFSLAARAPKARPKAEPSGVASTKVDPSAGALAKAELELMSLHDARQSGSLTITGLVQNPRTGAHLSRVAVTAYTFDDHGSFLASGRALLDVTALAPGDESPFTVTVPVTDNVARYRIGFRDEAGRVIAHIDRRDQGSGTRDQRSDN